MNHAEPEKPSTHVTSAVHASPTPAQNAQEYQQLRDYLFGDVLKSKRFEARLERLCGVLCDQVAVTPSEASSLREAFILPVKEMMNSYFKTHPLVDDPKHAEGKTRLDILAEQRTTEALSSHKAVTQIYANMRRFAELVVDKSIQEGLAQHQGMGRHP